jgi:septum formation topological specificity factor MinE
MVQEFRVMLNYLVQSQLQAILHHVRSSPGSHVLMILNSQVNEIICVYLLYDCSKTEIQFDA